MISPARIIVFGTMLSFMVFGLAYAHPVPVGRYVEVPYGFEDDHPHRADRGGPRRNGRLYTVIPTARPTKVWQVVLPARRLRGPILTRDGGMFVAGHNGVFSLDAEGGILWHAAVGAVEAAPSLTPSGSLVALTRGGRLISLSRQGMVQRTRDFGYSARGAPLVLDDGSIIVQTMNGTVHGVDARFRTRFQTPLPNPGAASLSSLLTGTLTVASEQSVFLLSPSGMVRRRIDLLGIAASPVVVGDDGTFWTLTAAQMLYRFESNGDVRVRTEVRGRHYAGASAALAPDGSLRLPLLEGLSAVGPGGALRWSLPVRGGFAAPVTVDSSGTTLGLSRGGFMLAVDADGRECWSVSVGTYSFQAPVTRGDGTIVVVTEQGQVQGWRAGTP